MKQDYIPISDRSLEDREIKRKQGRDYYHATRARRLELNKKRYQENKDWFYLNNRKCVIKKKYGISYEEYEALRIKQNDRCLICDKEEKNRTLAVDHCHESGRVRGLLCGNCNRGLGLFRDNSELLAKATNYLIRSNSN